MKNYKLLALAVCFFAANLIAQTADQDVAAGRTALTAHNTTGLAGAYANFNAAVTLSPTNETANALLAVTRILVLPQQPTGSNFLTTLGFSKAGRDIYNWTSNVPHDANGNSILPSINTSVGIALYKSTVIPALGASRTNLSRITDTNFTLSLTADETATGQPVTIDYGDILLMQAELYAAEFFGYTANAHNFNFVFSQIQGVFNGAATLQTVLASYPNLLAQNSLPDLANSKVALTNAIALYQQASDFIRSRPPGTVRLFNLGDNEVAGEAQFRTALTNVLLSLNGPVLLTENSPFSVDLSNYFSGAKSLRSLVPKFNGDSYVKNTVPDYTFGGIIQGVLACETERFLRQFVGNNTAGIYAGQVNDYANFGSNAGSCGIFVSTNGQVTIIADDTFQQPSKSVFVQTTLDSQGHVDFFNKDVGGSGSFYKDGSFSIQLYYTNGVTVSLDGYQVSPDNFLQNGAGFYTGSFSGSGSGSLDAVVGADGEVYFCSIQGGVVNDFGTGQIDSDNNFTGYTDGGISVTGTNYPSTLTISGTYDDGQGGTGSFTLKNPVRVLSDVPPAITTDLPPSTSAPLGNLVKLSVGVNGSAPLCYQWYLNGVPITNATSNPLVISNVEYADAGNYSVTIQNVVGETNSLSEILNVTPETNRPTISITTPTPGSNLSNAFYIVRGQASDNVAVSNVVVQLNGGGPIPVVISPLPSYNAVNWSAIVNLTTPGPNTVQAYAVDTSGNVSSTKTVNFNYVVSAPLTVQVTGKGTFSPNYTNLVAIGTTNSITATATAGSGFAFTNWTGGTSLPLSLLTNGPTLKFVMVSNLVLQANFVDVTRPTLAITNSAPGLLVTNVALFQVGGKCADNVAVADVQVSVNGGGWMPAALFNNNSNWTAQVSLTPGTNTVQAFAVDTTGNHSLTNSVKCFDVVKGALTVAVNGQGTISPAGYANTNLNIGVNYTLTATPKPGFGFTNWTDGSSNLVSTKAVFQFLMMSNLSFVANFVDVTRPTLAITNSAPGLLVTNVALFQVGGKCADNVAVADVQVSVNGGGWMPAALFNNNSNWTAQVSLTPGTNTVQAFAVDTTGNHSLTNSVKCFDVVKGALTVAVNGQGTISPAGYANTNLNIGVNYTLTATPKPGFGFTNWTDGSSNLVSTKAVFQFLMMSNLSFVANFVDVTRPTLAITNSAPGLLVTNVALFQVGGKCADNVAVADVQVSVNGGGWMPAALFNNNSNWTAQVSLTPGTNTVQAFAVDTTGNHSLTNSVKCFDVVKGALTVAVNGQGTISPAGYANTNLNIGVNYTLTATPKPGFGFTNWTDGSSNLVSTKAVFQFLMMSNLSFVANFVDVTRPTLAITNSAPGLLVTNVALFQVGGKCADNVAVADVQVSVNGGGWMPAALFNNNSNWTAQVSLTPGTNTVQAFAVDTTGNHSLTNSVKCFDVVKGALTVAVNGQGTISPAGYANTNLNIGVNYTLTATPKPGFGFYYWGGDVAMNTNKTLTFTLSSNLMITANFRDVTPPTVAVTAPKAGQVVSNTAAFTVTVTAADNVAVSNVWVQLNGGGFQPADPFGGSNWTAQVSLTPGTNTVQAFAVDTSGIRSATNTAKAIYKPDTRTIIGSWNLVQFITPSQIYFDGNGNLQGGTSFMVATGNLTIYTNGTLDGTLGGAFTGTYTNKSNGLIAAEIITSDSSTPINFYLNANKDSMTEVYSDTNDATQEIVCAQRIPPAFSFADVAGKWNVVLFNTPAQITYDINNGLQGGTSDNFGVQNGTLTLKSDGTCSSTVGSNDSGTYTIDGNGQITLHLTSGGNIVLYVNFNKDLMTHEESGFDSNDNHQEIGIITRIPSSISASDITGVWNLVDFDSPSQVFIDGNGDIGGNDEYGVDYGTLTFNSNGTVNANVQTGSYNGTYTIGSSGTIHANIGGQIYTFYLNAGKDTMAEVGGQGSGNILQNGQQIFIVHRVPTN